MLYYALHKAQSEILQFYLENKSGEALQGINHLFLNDKNFV